MEDREIKRACEWIGMHPDDAGAYNDVLTMVYEHIKAGESEWHGFNKGFRGQITDAMRWGYGLKTMEKLDLAYRRSLLIDAPVDFDSFMLYLEQNRKPADRFYLPRRKVLRPIVEAFQEVHDGMLDLLTVSQPKRTGKALPVETLVMTPTGYRRIGDLKVGDEITSVYGNRTTVTGVYPQGMKKVFKVTLCETGHCPERTVIECCGDHLWTVKTEDDRDRGHERVMSTRDMMNGRMRRGGDNHKNYSIDYNGPVEFDPCGELPLRPYLLGVLIADGGLTDSVRFTSPDEQVIERVRHEIPDGDCVKLVSGLTYGIVKTIGKGSNMKCKTQLALEKCGLMGKHSYEKHIPHEYLFASYRERIELLHGLFDCDGYGATNGCEYSTSSETLANDVAFLVRGLGGRANVYERMGRYKVNGEHIETRKSYRVMCKFPAGFKPFWLKRKAMMYSPQTKQLRHFIENIEATDEYKEMVCISVADRSEQFLVGEKMIPTHNTTVGTWFVLFRAGNAPNGSSICVGAGDGLVKSFYTGMLEVLTQKDKYLFYDVFPAAQLVQTNADEKIINLKDRKRFATITCRPIDGQITGSTEATPDGVTYLDDCVKNEEEAINRDRLELLWDKIRGDVLGRRLEGCPIVAQGTRYSLYDPIGRLQEVAPNMGWRTKVVEIPALDPVTDESNFEITVNGRKMFTTEHFRHERGLVTEMQWESQFQQHPFEARGRLFPESELNRYFELPVDRDPDAVIAVCDTAEKGTDSVMMPVAYIYGEDVFIVDVVFNNGTPQYTKPECANMLVKHKVSTATFESNSAGEYFARDVEQLVRDSGHRISIRTKRTISNKQNRIENASDGILKHFYFKDRSLYTATSEYGMMMREFTGYTRSGKVKHDDAPDGLSLLENEIRNLSAGKVEVMRRLW